MISGISSTVIHAPSMNFVNTTTNTVMPVQTAPRPLTSMPKRDFSPPAFFQCAIIPACDSVKARNAPTA